MEAGLQSIVEQLSRALGATVEEFRGEVTLTVPAEKVVMACEQVKAQGFEMLVTVTAVDYWPQEESRFHVVYQFLSLSRKVRLGLRVPLSGVQPSLPTISHLYGNANWREREIWDMFGIRFVGHPDLRRILMPADWEGHPLRKDYPLGYEEPQFTVNFEEINRRKPYAPRSEAS